jgi:Protein of unknown function (DUF3592)
MMQRISSDFTISGIFTIGILLYAGYCAVDTLHQYQSTSYLAVEGTVAHSEVIVSHGSRGSTHYHAKISYGYQVAGMPFGGDRYRFELDPEGSAWSQAMVDTHPAGSDITVYYDPRDSSRSLLSPGFTGSDLALYFVLAAGLAAFGYVSVESLVDARSNSKAIPAGGVQMIPAGLQTRIRLPKCRPAEWGVGGFAIASIMGGTALWLMTPPPDIQCAGMIFLMVSAATVVIYCWRRLRFQSGVDDLIIDEGAHTLTLPQTFGRQKTVTWDIGRVKSVYVSFVPRKRYLRGSRDTETWSVMLLSRDALDQPEKIAVWQSSEKSEALAAWLREKLHLPEPAAEPATQPDT